MSKPEDFKFDSRVRGRLLRNRTLTSSEVKQHVDQLPDLEGEYELMTDVAQPAVTPARPEPKEEPIVFEGIRRLQSLSDSSAGMRHAASPLSSGMSSGAPSSGAFSSPLSSSSSGLPAYREPEGRALGTPLRSALMESEISGVGAGAVSAALGAMAAEARNAAGFGLPPLGSGATLMTPAVPSPPVPAPPAGGELDVPTPVTLRSEATPKPAPAADALHAAEPTAAAAADDDEADAADDDEDDAADDDEDEDDDDDDGEDDAGGEGEGGEESP